MRPTFTPFPQVLRRAFVLAVIAVLGVAVFNPETPNLIAGMAHAGLYTAVLAPLFWVPRLRLQPDALRRAVMILWVFHTLSAALGVLQVYFPGQFQPGLSSIVLSKGEGYIESLKIVTARGWFAARPSGTENIYKIYAESFRDAAHLAALVAEAQQIVDAAVAG